MQLPQPKICDNCEALVKLYEGVDCSIYQLSRNKWLNQTYNTQTYFDFNQYRDLLRYKRIIYKRLRNTNYLCNFTNDSIVSLVTKNLYNPDSCPKCCYPDFEGFIPATDAPDTTTTSTLAPITSTSTTLL